MAGPRAAMASRGRRRLAVLTSLPGAPEAWPDRQNQNPRCGAAGRLPQTGQEYVDLREKLKETLPKLADQSPPEDVQQHQRALGTAASPARGQARSAATSLRSRSGRISGGNCPASSKDRRGRARDIHHGRKPAHDSSPRQQPLSGRRGADQHAAAGITASPRASATARISLRRRRSACSSISSRRWSSTTSTKPSTNSRVAGSCARVAESHRVSSSSPCSWGMHVGTAGVLWPDLVSPAAGSAQSATVALPNRDGSLKFAVLGDWGNGSREQAELAGQMSKLRGRFPFELVITVGDNIYGGNNAQSLRRRFEDVYKDLISAGVKFYASLGNHDDRELQRRYALFNMDGKFYYTFKAPHQDVRFFALESSYLDVAHIGWIQKELQESGEKWKIPYFHHPLYSSGQAARLAGRRSHDSRAAVHEVQHQRRLRRPRPFLRAHQPAKRNRSLRRRLGWSAEAWEHRGEIGAHRQRFRYRSGVSRRRDRRRRDVLQRHRALRAGRGLRRHPAPAARRLSSVAFSSFSFAFFSADLGGAACAQSVSKTD